MRGPSWIFPVNPGAYWIFIKTLQLLCQGFMIDRTEKTSEDEEGRMKLTWGICWCCSGAFLARSSRVLAQWYLKKPRFPCKFQRGVSPSRVKQACGSWSENSRAQGQRQLWGGDSWPWPRQVTQVTQGRARGFGFRSKAVMCQHPPEHSSPSLFPSK